MPAQRHQADVLGKAAAEARPETVRALLLMMAARDRATYSHLRHVSLYSTRLARTLALPEEDVQQIRVAALLHDIGKVAIPEAVLQKPGRLNDEEARLVRDHPRLGAELLTRFDSLAPFASLVHAHHEWYDGSGYPNGLAGEEIPLGARVIALADAFDTMTTPRPYRRPVPVWDAITEIRRHSGTQFDPVVVEACEVITSSARLNRLPWLPGDAANHQPAEPLALRLGRQHDQS